MAWKYGAQGLVYSGSCEEPICVWRSRQGKALIWDNYENMVK